MMFRDREDAARQLAARLQAWKGRNPLVLAIPRGAVPMASIIAEALDGDLDVVLVHKLGAPGNPEFAIGAVDEAGNIHVAEHAELAGADAPGFRPRRGSSWKRCAGGGRSTRPSAPH